MRGSRRQSVSTRCDVANKPRAIPIIVRALSGTRTARAYTEVLEILGRPARGRRNRIGLSAALASACALVLAPAPASAQDGGGDQGDGPEEILQAASYPDMTTYRCHSEPFEIR